MGNKNLSFITSRLIIGCSIVVIGIILLLGNLDIINPDDYLRYWPIFLIIIGINYILQEQSKGTKRWGWILTILGSILLLNKIFIQFSLWDYWPLILIAIGISMLLKARTGYGKISHSDINSIDDSSSYIKCSSILSGMRRSSNSQEFIGGELTAVMGGIELNLRNASIKDTATLDVFVLMGGIDIIIPDDWYITIEGVPFMGGFDDKTHPPKIRNKQLIIKGNVIMGGIDIKN